MYCGITFATTKFLALSSYLITVLFSCSALYYMTIKNRILPFSRYLVISAKNLKFRLWRAALLYPKYVATYIYINKIYSVLVNIVRNKSTMNSVMRFFAANKFRYDITVLLWLVLFFRKLSWAPSGYSFRCDAIIMRGHQGWHQIG